MKKSIALLFFTLFSVSPICQAQDNYEIQVYGSDLVAPGKTMLELHSNLTLNGSRVVTEGVLPTKNALHETIEVTHGFNEWFEVGFYFFNSIGDQNRTNYVGSHIRPRFAVPESEHLPVGLSLSLEVGFQKPQFCSDDWTLELRPIIDKTLGPWYLAFNPTLDHSLHGSGSGEGFHFSPNFKLGYAINDFVSPGLEYYGALGPVLEPSPGTDQEHQIFGVVDLNFSPEWEFNAGYGVSISGAADSSILKIILGRRFN